MQKPTLTTFFLIFVTLILLSLALWSLQMYTCLDDSRLLQKGIVLAIYSVGLFLFALFAKPRPRRIMSAGMVAILIGGEIFIRLTAEPAEDPDFRQGVPYIMFAGQPDGKIEAQNITLTDLGYRDNVLMPKPAGEYRVIMLGGSAVFQGSPREFSIAGALENALHNQGYENIRVYNWGVYSTVSAQELVTILFRAVDYDPDMILVYDGSNDLTEPYFFDPRPGYPFDYMATEGSRRIIEGDFSLFDIYAILLRPTSLGYRLFQPEIEEQITRRTQLEDDVEAGSDEWQEAIVTQYAENLAKMCLVSQAFDVNFVALLQPMIFFKETLTGREPHLLGPDDYQNHTRTVYEMARTEYQHLAETYPECTFRDGSRILASDTNELFVDPVHLNNEGYAMVGRRLADIVIEEQ